jgi:hypothetical protein
MKKTLLLLSVLAGFAFASSAQVACTPDTTHFTATTKVYPDTLPCIQQGVAFAGVITLQVPDSLDANQFFSAIPAGTAKVYIDSIQVVSVTGMPAGITSVSNPVVSTTWLKPGQYACANFTGTTTATAGNYPLTITGNGCGHATFPVIGYVDSCLNNFSFSRIYPYSLKVCGTLGVSDVVDGLNLNVYPNPNQGNFTVTISSAPRVNGTMSVVDQLGRTISTQSLDVTGTKQIALNLGNISAGAYMLVINSENGRSVKQFSVK